MASVVDIIIRANDQASSTIQGVGKAAVAGFAVAGVAAAGFAAKAVSDFVSFERGMNEVFTLIPGTSQQAMDDMTGQVKDFAKEFGVLPEKVVPALYQSLSAGVPPDNVFSFLEVAQKAAAGGVTELETAVDGISSVVNAYGSDVISAAQASDLMFTAVKLGKTNFDQLSKSLFNVTPTSAALGVSFGDVTAALAAMTAQGVPTSVATTQLRQLFVELSKEGGKTSKTFKELAGKGFKDFIAEGGNMQGALQLMEEHAKKTGVGINDLFGSVEAGGAALSLTGGGTEAFSKALDEMANSAGATDTAWEQMQQGLGPVIDKLKAFSAVMLLEVGGKIAPILTELGRGFIAFKTAFLQGGSEITSSGIAGWFERMGLIAHDVFETIKSAWQSVVDGFNGNISGMQGANATFEKIGEVARTVFDWLQQNVPPVIDTISTKFNELVEALTPFWEAIKGNENLLITLGYMLGTLLVAGVVALTASLWSMAAAVIAATWPFLLAAAVIFGVVTAIRYAYDNFEWFREGVQTVVAWLQENVPPAFEAVKAAVQVAFDWIANVALPWAQEAFNSFIGFLNETFLPAAQNVFNAIVIVVQVWWTIVSEVVTRVANFISDNWDHIAAITGAVWNMISGVIQTAWTIISNIIQLGLNIIKGDWSAAWENVKAIFIAVWNGIVNQARSVTTIIGHTIMLIVSYMGNMIGGVISKGLELQNWFRSLPGRILAAIGNLGRLLWNAGADILRGLIDGVKSKIGELKSQLGRITSLIPSWKGPRERDRQLLVEPGQLVMEGFMSGISDRVPALARQLGAIAKQVASTVERAPSGLAAAAGEALRNLRSRNFFEDFTGMGMSANLERFHNQLAEGFFGANPGADFGSWDTISKIDAYLSRLSRGAGDTNIYVSGSVLSERELMKLIRQERVRGGIGEKRGAF